MSAEIAAAIVFIFVTNFSPGPNNILSGSMGAIHGYRGALPFMLGVAGGVMILMFLCLTMSSLLTTYLPSVTPWLRPVGAAYMLWLAFGIFRHFEKALQGPDQVAPLRFWNGLVLQFANPKTIFFGLTVYSVYLVPILESRPALLISPVLLMAVCFSALSTWAVAGHLIRSRINTPRRARILGTLLALALVWTAVDLLGVHLW